MEVLDFINRRVISWRLLKRDSNVQYCVKITRGEARSSSDDESWIL